MPVLTYPPALPEAEPGPWQAATALVHRCTSGPPIAQGDENVVATSASGRRVSISAYTTGPRRAPRPDRRCGCPGRRRCRHLGCAPFPGALGPLGASGCSVRSAIRTAAMTPTSGRSSRWRTVRKSPSQRGCEKGRWHVPTGSASSRDGGPLQTSERRFYVPRTVTPRSSTAAYGEWGHWVGSTSSPQSISSMRAKSSPTPSRAAVSG